MSIDDSKWPSDNTWINERCVDCFGGILERTLLIYAWYVRSFVSDAEHSRCGHVALESLAVTSVLASEHFVQGYCVSALPIHQFPCMSGRIALLLRRFYSLRIRLRQLYWLMTAHLERSN